MKRIIFPTDEGGVKIIVPAPAWLAEEGNTMEVLAEEIVPAGTPYKIVDVSDISSDRTFRDAWEYTA